MLPFVALALALMFAGAGALIGGLMLSRKARVEMERRVKLIAGGREMGVTTDALGGLLKIKSKNFDVQVRRIFTFGLKHSWAMQIGSLTLLLVAAVSGGAVWVLTNRFFGLSGLPSVALSVSLFYLAPRFLLSRQQKRAERQFMDSFPDAVDTIGRMLRAGLPITAAVSTVATDGSPPVSTVFATIADQLKIGVPIEETLDKSSRQIGLSDFRFFTVAVALQYSTGGNLTSTLEILSNILRKRRATRLKAKAATGEIRITAYTLGGIPFLTTGALLVIQPGYLTPLWTDPRGHFILAMAAGGLFLTFFSMRMMMRSVTNG